VSHPIVKSYSILQEESHILHIAFALSYNLLSFVLGCGNSLYIQYRAGKQERQADWKAQGMLK